MISRVCFKYPCGTVFDGHGIGNRAAIARGAYEDGALGVSVVREQS